MPFPQINNCLICEDVRLERRRLATLIGFYGVTPNVHILVRELNLPLERLTFFMMGERGEGQYQVRAQILNEEGNVITQSQEMSMVIRDPAREVNLGTVFYGVRFQRPGRFNLTLVVDGETHYQTSFEVSQGSPEDFVEAS